ncbi:thymidylate kinase [Candidatus Woesearchaeota archaeon]|nr:thymidylate kinase [Candidatus Woesearchaeota archaeon]
MEKGKFIVIDGGDGSGKKTQLDLLATRLCTEGRNVETFDFPQYGDWSAQFVEKYLRGEFGGVNEVSAKKASLFYALDRFEAAPRITDGLNQGAVVLSNRYVSANKGHQLGKINNEKEMREFLGWLNELEYGILGIPVPDLTLFLHMTPEIGQALVDSKGDRAYLQGKKRDIHEADINHLKNAERAYLFCLENDSAENWKRILCFSGEQPRTREAVHQDIYTIVTELIKK